MDYSADTYSDDQQEKKDYSNEDREAIPNNEDYYSGEDDGEAAKKTNHKGDGEATEQRGLPQQRKRWRSKQEG